MTGRFDLDRFVRAQEGTYTQVLAELRSGRKRTHWMWFIFPQFRGLGVTQTSRHYAIGSLDEARAYLEHPLLGPRLRQCVETLLVLNGRSAQEIFGYPDVMKLKSSATLFARASHGESLFQRLLDTYYQGDLDEKTLRLLEDVGESSRVD